MNADASFLVAGFGLLLGAIAARILVDRALSTPVVVVLVGAFIGLFVRDSSSVSPVLNPGWAEHLTEVTVIISLMGVGLAIDRPLSWRGWTSTRRLLGIAMPLAIGAVAVLAWGLMGIAPAAALLIAAALAPTDPVLASDVQVGAPVVAASGADADEAEQQEAEAEVESDHVRFALTTEAGLNDGLAFPFLYAAIFLVAAPVTDWGLSWLAWELVGKVALGAALGWVTGKGLGLLAFRSRRDVLRFAEGGEPLVALAATLAVYGVAEVLQGYGFVAVFVAALALRSTERHHDFHGTAHSFIQQLEHILTFGVLLLLGMALTSGLLGDLTWQGALVGVLLLLVIRPVTAWVSLIGVPELGPRDRLVTSFFGVRGIGSLYYVAYGLAQAEFEDGRAIWSTVTFTVVLSVLLHGITATPAMAWLERHRQSTDHPTDSPTDGSQA